MRIETSNNAFWVYILQSEKQKQWTISTTRDIECITQQCQNSKNGLMVSKMIYCRRFDEMILALGHKMLLSFLDSKSVKSIIRRENPTMEDLSLRIDTARNVGN